MIRFLVFVAAAVTASPTLAQTAADPPYRVTRPADRITCFSPGLETSPVTTCVIETGPGLVAVDTGLSHSMAERTRRRIAAELGRDDIRWVINTHSHFDHTGGNQAFADAMIIGHDSTTTEMQAFFDGREVWIERRLGWLERQATAAESDHEAALEERLRFNNEMIEDLRTGYRSTPPTLTFSDRATLHAGDLEIQLVYFGRAHTQSDILISIPELKALFTGDLFHDDVLGVASGSPPLDVEQWLKALDFVLADGPGAETVLGGHGLVFTPDWVAAQRRYLETIWSAVGEAKSTGKTLPELSLELAFVERFSDIARQFDLPAEDLAEQHSGVLQTMWRVGQGSAADEIGRAARDNGTDSARARWAELQKDASYYVDEGELNALGYQLLQRERKVAEALAVFEINTEAFPLSWNTWDSYAEAHWWIGDQDGVERHYRKALELNPEAESARRGISQIEGYRLDRAGETTVAASFDPGAPTELDGPYLGQRPPGTTPEVFAPGVVSTAEGFEYSIALSPDGSEIFFTRRIEPDGLNTLWVARLSEHGWLAPEPADVSSGWGANEPHISPDGDLLFFGSQPPEGPGPGIWVAERETNGWGEPRFHGRGMFVSSTRDGDLFMWNPDAGRGGGIVHYPKSDGGWSAPEPLDGGVNQPRPGVHGWVAPDGSFIVFDSYQRPGAQGGEGDLFVAFRNNDGSWGEAFNLGDNVNTPGTNFCPALSPDGKFLFFATNRDIYWVSAEVIDRHRPE